MICIIWNVGLDSAETESNPAARLSSGFISELGILAPVAKRVIFSAVRELQEVSEKMCWRCKRCRNKHLRVRFVKADIHEHGCVCCHFDCLAAFLLEAVL